MDSLKENDWNVVNDILLEIYSMDNINEIAVKFLQLIRALISYSQAYFIIFDEEQKIDIENSAFDGVSEENKSKYVNYFYDVDYVKHMFGFSKTLVFKDTDMMEDEIREKTEFYQGFLRPQNIPYGEGILLVKGEILGVLNIFRSKDLGDFKRKDIRILEVFKNHLTNILYSTRKESNAADGRKPVSIKDIEKYNLSNREKEIMDLMLQGDTNEEISEKLFIAISTVKKHVYNIFTKMGINSRIQLMKLVEK
ncbi:MAG: LuxR C-terminal-related transcriptional regulator [Lachnospiraceae bacterium]